MATGTRSRLRPAEETQPTTASTSPTGVTSATNRSDAPAVEMTKTERCAGGNI